MESISQRIEKLIKVLGHNKNSFSKAIGLGNNVTIGRIINENRDPSFEVLQKIMHTFGEQISAKWLLTGEGRMKAHKKSMLNEPDLVYHAGDVETVIANLQRCPGG